MVVRSKKPKRSQGQAAIELAFSLPFLIWLIFYTMKAFHSVHTAHVGQRYAAMNLYQRLNNRAQFVMDDQGNQAHGKEYMAVQYLDTEGKAPRRGIIREGTTVLTVIGTCLEPGCQ